MKMFKKSDLTVINGMLVFDNGDVVIPDKPIIEQANELETLLQKVEYLAKQPSAAPMPSLDGFERESIDDGIKGEFVAHTPLADYKMAEALALMDELDDANVANEANAMLSTFVDLIRFVESEYVIDCGSAAYKFDTPRLGSVLGLTKDDVINVVAKACGMERDEDDDDDSAESLLDELKSVED